MKRFTPDEDAFILKSEREGVSIDDVCKILDRDRTSVIFRYGYLTYGTKHEPTIDNYSVEELCEQLGKKGAMIEGNKIVVVEMKKTEFSLNS